MAKDLHTSWQDLQAGRKQTAQQIEAGRSRAPDYDPAVHGGGWFENQADAQRAALGPLASRLDTGSYRPSTHWKSFRQNKEWGWSNPFGARNWFWNWSPWQRTKDWWNNENAVAGSPLQEKIDISRKIRKSREYNQLRKRFQAGKMDESQFKELAGAGMNDILGVTDFDRNLNQSNAELARLSHKGDQLAKRWGDFDVNMGDALARAAERAKTGSFQKQAAFDWIVNRGNRQFNKQLESALASPQAAEPFFNKIRDRMEGKKPGFWSRLNPLNWMENWYLSDPRSMRHIKSRMASRLSAPDTQRRMFPNRPGRLGALGSLMGPLGWGGAGLGLYGLVRGDPVLSLLGLAGVAGQGYLQYSKARDPRTWISALATPRNRKEIETRRGSRGFLSRVSGLMQGKRASEKTAGSSGWGKPARLIRRWFNRYAKERGLPMSNARIGASMKNQAPFLEKIAPENGLSDFMKQHRLMTTEAAPAFIPVPKAMARTGARGDVIFGRNTGGLAKALGGSALMANGEVAQIEEFLRRMKLRNGGSKFPNVFALGHEFGHDASFKTLAPYTSNQHFTQVPAVSKEIKELKRLIPHGYRQSVRYNREAAGMHALRKKMVQNSPEIAGGLGHVPPNSEVAADALGLGFTRWLFNKRPDLVKWLETRLNKAGKRNDFRLNRYIQELWDKNGSEGASWAKVRPGKVTKRSRWESLFKKLGSDSGVDAGVYGYTPPNPDPDALDLLRSHFPVHQGRKAILESTNMSLPEKWRLLTAFNRSTIREPERGTTTLGKVLPSLAGAGLGWLGASLAAPLFTSDQKTKSRLGIAGSALGAILNNQHITGLLG